MRGNFIMSNKTQINRAIANNLESINKNIPCIIEQINDDYTADIKSLYDNSLYKNISIFYPMGAYFDKNRLKYGLLINSEYWFGSLIDEGKLENTFYSGNSQFGIFVPIFDKDSIDLIKDTEFKDSEYAIYNTKADNYLSMDKDNINVVNKDKAKLTFTDGVIELKNNDDNESITMDKNIVIKSNQDNITLDKGVSIKSSSPMEIKTDASSLYEVLNDILNMLTKMNLDPIAGNGSPLASPTLTADLPTIITKLNGVLK